MSFYARLQATAERLIAEYGKVGYIVRETRSGPPHAPVVTTQQYQCALVETGESLVNRAAVLIEVGDRLGIISPDVAVTPALHDRLGIDGETYRLVRLEPLNPGGTVLLYEFQARK